MTKRTALIVDDSRLARLTLAKLLSKKDIDVKEAESVNTAYEFLTEHKDNLPDMIFMDINMPEVDGIEGVKIIKANDSFSHIPCSMYSSEPSVEIQKKATMVGAQAYLYKPANEEDLDEVLKLLETVEPVAAATTQPAEDVPATAASVAGGEPASITASQVANKAIRDNIQVVDRRTKNLARILMQERKENAATIKSLENRIDMVVEDIDPARSAGGNNIDTQRLENDLTGQLKTMQGKLNTSQMISYIAIAVAVLAIIIAIV